MKPPVYWCVFFQDRPYKYTIEDRKEDSIDAFFSRGPHKAYLNWERAQIDGYRCKKVHIVEVGR